MTDDARADGVAGPAAPVPAPVDRGPALVLTVLGAGCVVLGGLVAAASGPLALALGSWAAAYLVLVAGVAQYAMGRSRAHHPGAAQRIAWAWTQVGAWNAGNALVIGGTLAGAPWLVDVGSALLVVALAIAFRASWPAAASPWLDRAYRVFLVLLAVSTVIGSALAHLRS